MSIKKMMPNKEQAGKELPSAEQEETREIGTEMEVKELPLIGNPENTMLIGGKLIEIKPTRLEYFRNRTAVLYKMLEECPLPDIFAMGANTFGQGRDGDKAVLDWIVGVVDDPEMITREVYDSMTSDDIYRMLSIFKRVNRIDEKEDKLKNAEAPRGKA